MRTEYEAYLAGFCAAAYPCPSERPGGELGRAWDAGAAAVVEDQEAADLAYLRVLDGRRPEHCIAKTLAEKRISNRRASELQNEGGIIA